MAIITSVPGLAVCVKVDGEPATEYENPDDEIQGMDVGKFDIGAGLDSRQAPYVIKYIEATPGARYTFRLTREPSFQRRSHHIGLGLLIDGELIGMFHMVKIALAPPQCSVSSEICHAMCGSPENGYRKLAFSFSPVEIVESDAVPEEELQQQLALAKHCGVLKVILFHMKDSNRESEPYIFNRRPNEDQGAMTLSEKALKGKAVDCRTTYTVETLRDFHPTMHINDYHDARRRAFAVYEFRYRSKDGLIKEGIIPRPDARKEVDNMTEAEVRQRLADLMERNQTLNNPRIKREAAPMADDEFMARYKTRRLDNGRVEVDLTDD